MEIRVLIRSCPKSYAAIPHPNNAPDEIDMNPSVGLRDNHVWKCGRTDGHWLKSHPLSSPCEPLTQVS